MNLFDKRAERTDTDSMKWLEYAGKQIMPLWVADADFPVAAPILEAIHARVDHGVFGYALPSTKLLQTCCEYFARRWDWQVDPEWIVASPGLGVALHTVCRMEGLKTGNILTPQPIYHVFRDAPNWAGKQRIDVPIQRDGNQWQLTDPLAIAKQAGGADVLMLCNPHNPGGKIFTKTELTKLAKLAVDNDWLICADEVHADLILDDSQHFPIAGLDKEVCKRTITLQSPSKAFNLAGLNFAVVVISDPQLRERYKNATRGQVVEQLNPIGMVAGQVAWSGVADEWRTQLLEHLRGNRELLSTTITPLANIEMPNLASTYLAWLDVSKLQLDNPPSYFEKYGLGMSSGATYGDADYMRLNFATDKSMIQAACEQLVKAVSDAG